MKQRDEIPASDPGSPESGPPAPGAVEPAEPRGAQAPAEPPVSEILQRLRSGIRQRRAEAANAGGELGSALGGPGDALAHQLLAVKTREFVQEPIAFSHRPRLGRLIVFSRKAFFHLFLKWFLRPLLEQQNGFNQAAARMLQELAESQDRLAREARQLAARLEELERRAGKP
jgi:hypothetical protein